MKKIWSYLVQHFREDFHAGQYIFIFIFLAASLTLNYAINLENGILDQQTGILKVAGFFATYSIGYYTILFSYTLFRKQNDFWTQRSFWIKSILGLLVLSLDASMPFLRPFVKIFFPTEAQYYFYRMGLNVFSLFIVIVPLLTYYYCSQDQIQRHVYGFRLKNFDYKPYALMLLIMMPLITIASFEASFMKQYPMYRVTAAHEWLGVSEWVTVLAYEISYGLDFITVEFLFRGFFVIGMASILGRKTILAMAAAYCFIHFGKPAGEAISSIVGGTILGIIALESRSIWGGILVHVGIAWMMEIAAFLQKSTA